jgi:hypothetical protein
MTRQSKGKKKAEHLLIGCADLRGSRPGQEKIRGLSEGARALCAMHARTVASCTVPSLSLSFSRDLVEAYPLHQQPSLQHQYIACVFVYVTSIHGYVA